MAHLQPSDIMDHGVFPCFDASVVAIDGLVPANPGLLESIGSLLRRKDLDILAQGPLIALECDDVIRLLVSDFLRHGTLASHGVDSDDSTFDLHHVEQRGNGNDLTGLLAHLDLRQRPALTRGKGRDHVDRVLCAFLLIVATQGFAIDRDDLGRGFGQRRNPAHKAALEGARVERGKNIAQGIMGRGSISEGAEAPQQGECLDAEPGEIGEAISSGQHGKQRQQQHLVQRINHLAALPPVGISLK